MKSAAAICILVGFFVFFFSRFAVRVKAPQRSPWVDNFEVLRSSGGFQRAWESEQRPVSEITRLRGGQANKRSKPGFPGSGSLEPAPLWSPPFYGPDENSVYLAARAFTQCKDVRRSVKLYYFDLYASLLEVLLLSSLPPGHVWFVDVNPPVWLVSLQPDEKQALRQPQGLFGPVDQSGTGRRSHERSRCKKSKRFSPGILTYKPIKTKKPKVHAFRRESETLFSMFWSPWCTGGPQACWTFLT